MLNSIQTMIVAEPSHHRIAIAVHHLGERRHHLRNKRELRRPQQMKKVQSRSEMPSNRHPVLDSMLRTRSEVCSHRNILDSYVCIAIESHSRPPLNPATRAGRILSDRAIRIPHYFRGVVF
jgi:hypothetical protein